MELIDPRFLQYISIATVIICVYFLIKYRAGNCISGYAIIVIGAQTFLGTNLLRIILAIDILTLLMLIRRAFLNRKFELLGNNLTKTRSLFIILILFLWLKIAFECLIGGMDVYRIAALKLAGLKILLPTLILTFSFVADGVEKTIKGVLLGLCLFPLAVILPLIYPMITSGAIGSAISGLERLTILGHDSINGGEMFFLGCLGFILASLYNKNSTQKVVFMSISVAFLILLLLNGTRQFLFAICMAALLLILTKRRIKGKVTNILIVIILAFSVYLLRGVYTEAQIISRMSKEELKSGRMETWSMVFDSFKKMPLFGVGFRNYGEEIGVYNSETHETTFYRDTAHGFLQDIFVEHGMFFGLLFLLSYIALFIRYLKLTRKTDYFNLKIMFILFFSLTVPESFSGTFWFSLGFYLFGISSLGLGMIENQLKPKYMKSGAQNR